MSTILNISANYYVENKTRYVFVDGHACKQLSACYAVLQQQLSIPDYFGNNLDALEEVLSDLDWIPEEKIKIIISNIPSLLINDIDRKNDFLDTLNSSKNEKVEIVYLGMTGVLR